MSNTLSKLIAGVALLAAAYMIVYFNMTLTWGLTLVSWPYFFLFWFLSTIVQILIQLVIK
jgi:hypothetical protein